ncbi:MAG: hypothetical protein IPH24_02500 [Crocinitomicaceae bacterium]|jgi:hypothetical protein|nr:hypothetical protein [Crocinitomicaceae bacterium]
MNYPIYRKFKGIDVWFKISSDTSFIEIKKLGTRVLISKIEAVQFPEKLLIQDMIAKHENRWEEVDQEVVERILKSEKFI